MEIANPAVPRVSHMFTPKETGSKFRFEAIGEMESRSKTGKLKT